MMFLPVLLLATCAVGVIYGDLALNPEEMAAIQERQEQYEILEKMSSFFSPEEKRDEDCIPEGGACKFGSGPNCCGISTRCVVFDMQIPQRKGPAKWLSACRKYKAGVAMEKIASIFKKP